MPPVSPSGLNLDKILRPRFINIQDLSDSLDNSPVQVERQRLDCVESNLSLSESLEKENPMAAVRSEKPASNSLDDEDEESDDMSGVELRKPLSD